LRRTWERGAITAIRDGRGIALNSLPSFGSEGAA